MTKKKKKKASETIKTKVAKIVVMSIYYALKCLEKRGIIKLDEPKNK